MRTLSATLSAPRHTTASSSTSWLLSSSVGAFLVLCAGAGITYIAQLVIARTIGPDSFGIYAYVVAWITLAAYVATLGFHTSLLRFLPAYEAQASWPLARGVLRCAFMMTLGLGAAMALTIVLGAKPLAHGNVEMAQALGLAALAVPLIATQLAVSAGTRAFGRPVVSLLPERIVRDGTALVLVGAAGALGLARLDATLAVLALVAGCAVALILAILSLRLSRPASLASARAASEFRTWFAPAIPLTIVLVADNVLARSGILALGFLGSIREAGLFAVAYSMAMLAALPRMAIASAFAPQVSALHARNDIAGLRTLSARASLLSLAATILVTIPLLAAAPTLLGWMGPSFVAATPIIAILISGQIFAACFGPQQHLLTMTGHERASATIFLGSAAFSVVASLVLIPILGIVGAALATTGSAIVFNCSMAHVISKYLTLPPGIVIALRRLSSRGRQSHAG